MALGILKRILFAQAYNIPYYLVWSPRRFAAKKAGLYPRDDDEAALVIDEVREETDGGPEGRC